jgi:hypothetical protein
MSLADSIGARYTLDEGTTNLRNFVDRNIISGNAGEIERIAKYYLYWNFYEGAHWKDYNETFLSFNYCKAFVNKVINFLNGKDSYSLRISRHDGKKVEPDIESAIEGEVNFHLNKTKKAIYTFEMFQMGGVCGTVWLFPEYIPAKKYIHIRVMDSRHVFPEFDNGDVSKLVAITIRTRLLQNPSDYKIKCLRYTNDNVEEWFQKDTATGDKVVKYQPTSTKNTYGFIPIISIKNTPSPNSYYGTSDLSDLMKINKTYNELHEEAKGVIEYYGTPTTVITGGTIRTLKKGLGNIWSGLPPEANVFNLSLGEDLSGTMQFLDRLKVAMHEISDVPESVLGKTQAISNTSAAALQIMYQPLLQQANLKWMMYGEGQAELHNMILRILKLVEPDKEIFQTLANAQAEVDDFFIYPIYSYGLPKDVLSELQIMQMKAQLKLDSRQNMMNQLGITDVPAVMDAIDEDNLRQGALQSQIQNIEMGNPTDNTEADNQQPMA